LNLIAVGNAPEYWRRGQEASYSSTSSL
jgi:hypothetical protein